MPIASAMKLRLWLSCLVAPVLCQLWSKWTGACPCSVTRRLVESAVLSGLQTQASSSEGKKQCKETARMNQLARLHTQEVVLTKCNFICRKQIPSRLFFSLPGFFFLVVDNKSIIMNAPQKIAIYRCGFIELLHILLYLQCIDHFITTRSNCKSHQFETMYILLHIHGPHIYYRKVCV